MPWLELEIDREGNDVLNVKAHASNGQEASQKLTGAGEFVAFRDEVMGAAESGAAELPRQTLAMAQRLFEKLFAGEIRAYFSDLEKKDCPEREPRMLFFKIGAADLCSVPWEALCRPSGKVDFLGLDTGFLVARRVSTDQKSYLSRTIEGGILRGLALAPHGGDAALLGLREAIKDGAMEWLPDLKGKDARTEKLVEALSGKSKRNVLHVRIHLEDHRLGVLLLLAQGHEILHLLPQLLPSRPPRHDEAPALPL